jgi:hypothetical protein
MKYWNVAICDPKKNDGAGLFLVNKSETLVTVNNRLDFDPLALFAELDKLNFPMSYTEGLEHIHFSKLRGNLCGYYDDNKIYVHVSKVSSVNTLQTFIHEVAHHVEEKEGIASFLHEEKIKRSKYIDESFSSRKDDEYLALGFERYYSVDPQRRRELKKRNPLLYKTIQLLHRDYSLKG